MEALAAERGAAANTLDSYGRDLKAFAKRLGRPLADAEAEDVRSYLEAMDRQGLSPATAARRLSSLRQFYKFLYAEGLSRRNPAATIESPRRRHKLPRILSEEQVTRLLEAAHERARTRPGLNSLRLVALLEMLYATGLRISELLTLTKAAVAGDRDFLVVRGKGGRERMVPLSGPARQAVG